MAKKSKIPAPPVERKTPVQMWRLAKANPLACQCMALRMMINERDGTALLDSPDFAEFVRHPETQAMLRRLVDERYY